MQRGQSSCFFNKKTKQEDIQNNKCGKTETVLSSAENTKTGNNHPQNPNTKTGYLNMVPNQRQ